MLHTKTSHVLYSFLGKMRFRGSILNFLTFRLQFSWSEVFFSTIILTESSWTAGHGGEGGLQNILSITSTSTISLYCQGVGKVRQQLLRQAFWLDKVKVSRFLICSLLLSGVEGKRGEKQLAARHQQDRVVYCTLPPFGIKIFLCWSITIYFQK